MKKFLDKIVNLIIKLRYVFLGLWAVLLIVALILIPKVQINYDTTKYLPDDVMVKESLKVMEEEFGLTGQASVMIENVEITDAIAYKKQLEKIDGINQIIWLDSFVDEETITLIDDFIGGLAPGETIDLGFVLGLIPGLDGFYKNKTALFQVMFEESEHSLLIDDAIEGLQKYLKRTGKHFAIAGTAIATYNTRVMTQDEVYKITLYVLPIILIILIIFSTSWAEPFLFLIVVGVSVLINMGSNYFFKEISFLTNSTASLLQLAISMDYSIFLLHQYKKQRDLGLNAKEAMAQAMKNSFLSINSSMLTTVAGFSALIFMRYTIGIDLSVVMIKGILLSLICVFTFMPALIIVSDKLLVKTKHRPFFPSLKKFGNFVYKIRYVLPALALLIVIPAYTTQSDNQFVYGEGEMGDSGGKDGIPSDAERIEDIFGKSNMIVVLVPKDHPETELKMVRQLEKDLSDYEGSIQSLVALTNLSSYVEDLDIDLVPPAIKNIILGIIDELIPEDSLVDQIPPEFKDQLVSENYSRLIITIKTDIESEEAFKATDIIEEAAAKYYFDEFHIIGVTTSVKEIKTVVESDYVIINLLSIGLVLLILLLTFRSAIVPVILILVIQLSIWINMAIPNLTGETLIFIGYMIVSAIQLGATIDYGILLTNTYLGARKEMNKKEAMKYSIVHSGNSILTSALILTTAGFALSIISSVESVSALGTLIGRGAFLSGFLTLFLLPQTLYLLDKWIGKTTYKSNFFTGSGEKMVVVESSVEDITEEDIIKEDVKDEAIVKPQIELNEEKQVSDTLDEESSLNKKESDSDAKSDDLDDETINYLIETTKAELDEEILEDDSSKLENDDLNLEKLTVPELMKLAKKRNLKNYSSLRKSELIKLLKDN